MVDVRRDISVFQPACRDRGVEIARPFPPLLTWARITIGTMAEMEHAVEALQGRAGRTGADRDACPMWHGTFRVAMAAGSVNPPPGLCGTCQHARVIPSDRGQRFIRCGKSDTDPRRRYPALPWRIARDTRQDGELKFGLTYDARLTATRPRASRSAGPCISGHALHAPGS